MSALSLPTALVHHLRTGMQWFRLVDVIGSDVATLLATQAVDRALELWPDEGCEAMRDAAWALRIALTTFPASGTERALDVLEQRLASLPAAA